MTSSTNSASLDRPRAAAVAVDAGLLRVMLQDGREIAVPIDWFDWLASATADQRGAVAITEGGAGLWWDELEDGLSVPGLLGLPEYP